MKKLLLGSISLLMFSVSVLIVQISCQKGANSQPSNGSNYVLPPATTTTLGGIIVGNGLAVTSNGTLSATSTPAAQQNKILFYKHRKGNFTTNWDEIWIANYDGTNLKRVNIAPPAGMSINLDSDVSISPDGQKVFFGMTETATGFTHVYSCNVDGTNLAKVVDGSVMDVNVATAY
jgi:hypothetical protein